MIKNILRTQIANWQKLNASPGAWLMEEMVVRFGADYPATALPANFRRMTPKACFANVRSLVRSRPRMTYVEGYAMRPGIFPVPHAWAVGADGVAIDPTWERSEECEYVGIAFTSDQFCQWKSSHSTSLFDTGRGINFKLAISFMPEFQKYLFT